MMGSSSSDDCLDSANGKVRNPSYGNPRSNSTAAMQFNCKETEEEQLRIPTKKRDFMSLLDMEKAKDTEKEVELEVEAGTTGGYKHVVGSPMQSSLTDANVSFNTYKVQHSNYKFNRNDLGTEDSRSNAENFLR